MRIGSDFKDSVRDYSIEGLPYPVVVKVENVPCDRLPRIRELSEEVLKQSGYDPKDAIRRKHHLDDDLSKPTRVIVMLILGQSIKELVIGDRPAIREPDQINKWLSTLADEALHRLLQVCVDRFN